MIYKNGQIREKFDDEHQGIAELRAYDRQILFYEKSKKILNKNIDIYLLDKPHVDEIENNYKIFKPIPNKTENILNSHIETCNKIKNMVKDDIDKYTRYSEKDNIKTVVKIASLFNINIKLLNFQSKYVRFKI